MFLRTNPGFRDIGWFITFMFGCIFDFVGFGFTDGFMLLRNETFGFRELSGANTVDRPAATRPAIYFAAIGFG